MKYCGHTIATAVLLVGLLPVASNAQDGIDFNRDVRPVLSDKCYFCHGPDEENRQADLRLDVRETAIGVIESGDLLERITSDDPDVVMPPPEAKLILSDAEKKTLEQWVDAGAKYDQHWAFKLLPKSVPVPEPSDWAKQTLDRFVDKRLETEGLKPNNEAEPLRWLRRVTFDLTGLPPTPDEVASFEKAREENIDAARESVVKRLLDSPAYGEHMAVAWLDAARYADSYGYQSDKLNTQWPYRDWVIRAFNSNLSYDKFLTWQLAGDLLENPTRDQRLATAFNRIHRLNNEGGAVFEEWRIENVADRVHTFGTAVLGLTMECCRCHDHKYDPIPMRDYYSLGAFFNSIDESGVYDRTRKVPCPSLLLPTPEQEATLLAARKKQAKAEAHYARVVAEAKPRYDKWFASLDDRAVRKLPVAELELALGFERKFDNTIKHVYHPSQSDRSWTAMPELVEVRDWATAQMPNAIADDSPKAPTGKRLAIKLDGERGITTEGVEPFDRWMPFTVIVTLKETKRSPDRCIIAHHTRGTDCGYNGWDLSIEDGHLESRMARVWPGNAMSVRTIEAIPANQWHQIAATYDGSSRAAGMKLFLNGVELKTEVIRDKVKKQANVKVDHGGQFVIGQRFRDRGLDGGLIDDVRVYFRDFDAEELRGVVAEDSLVHVSFRYYLHAIDEPAREAWYAMFDARKAVVLAEEAMDEIPVMEEMDRPRPAHVLARGAYDAPTDESTLVERDTFGSFGVPFPKDAPRDRLGLAKWVTDPQHPLTARVAVNRLWANFFSEPLVRTPENFGLQGELPTHPELLDWLARDFIDNGWDVKRFCRQVVLSATYMQDSRVDSDRLKADPENTLLARGPANRLSAEQLRDLALAASGLLNATRGGPPVSPYQPGADLWRESNGMSPPYQQSVGKALHRRSLYSFWKRTAPLPNMMALDATTREVCSVKRARTNTPLQALVLLNDIQFVEASRVLAARVLAQKTDTGRVRFAFRSLAGRNPDEREAKLLNKLFDEERAYFEQHPKKAEQLLKTGESSAGNDSDIELAAMTVVCQAILNLDATVWKR